jgi:hypothetical protein
MRSLPFQLVGVGLLTFVAAGCAGLPPDYHYLPPAGYSNEQIRRDMSECSREAHPLGSPIHRLRLSSAIDAGTPHDMTVLRTRGGHSGGHGHRRGLGSHARHGFLWWAPLPYYWDYEPYYWDYYYWAYERCMQDLGYKLAPGDLYVPPLQGQYP